jgi:hypothetical protein
VRQNGVESSFGPATSVSSRSAMAEKALAMADSTWNQRSSSRATATR